MADTHGAALSHHTSSFPRLPHDDAETFPRTASIDGCRGNLHHQGFQSHAFPVLGMCAMMDIVTETTRADGISRQAVVHHSDLRDTDGDDPTADENAAVTSGGNIVHGIPQAFDDIWPVRDASALFVRGSCQGGVDDREAVVSRKKRERL